MSSKRYCNLLPFSVVFYPSAYANDHLRPKVRYENDRKSEADLLIYKSKKVAIFDQKMIEVANIGTQVKSVVCLVVTVIFEDLW